MNTNKQKPYLITLIKCRVVENESAHHQCIWCGEVNKKNVAHIVSRKLIKSEHEVNKLKRSVCTTCNSFFGNGIEDWIFKYTPVATWANQVFNKAKTLSNLRYVPNFIWMDSINEWLVTNHDYVRDLLGNQLILNSKEDLIYFSGHLDHDTPELATKIMNLIEDDIMDGRFTTYIEAKLPDNFSPRAFQYKGKVIVLGRTQEALARLLAAVEQQRSKNLRLESHTFPKIKDYHTHYSWSIKRYLKLCSKIAYEFLTLMESDNFCKNIEFSSFKYWMLHSNNYAKSTLPYVEGKGFNAQGLLPKNWLSLVDMSDAPETFPILISPKKDCHCIFIYEVSGYLLFNVQLFNVEPALMIVAKNIKLEHIYYIEYNFIEDTFNLYTRPKSFNKLDNQSKYDEFIEQGRTSNNVACAYFMDQTPPTLFC
ncbi:hypothetical protein [Pedobacter cryotolerans]|uniref:HNH endonuclease n=1 Tax=Pedobacter cryotolerans TaxID=2571270 RepID=A0A4U1BXE4_9SPHI|nr:hypothetical protein [Pedobacter cryotolerans]TKB96180.1 hypothetical protein FA045_18570 [Pedobacter cryotolerans]